VPFSWFYLRMYKQYRKSLNTLPEALISINSKKKHQNWMKNKNSICLPNRWNPEEGFYLYVGIKRLKSQDDCSALLFFRDFFCWTIVYEVTRPAKNMPLVKKCCFLSKRFEIHQDDHKDKTLLQVPRRTFVVTLVNLVSLQHTYRWMTNTFPSVKLNWVIKN
jgi:hypothetical protein